MKLIAFVFALLCMSPLVGCGGFYAGAGFSWNTVDETFDSNLHTNQNRSGQDRYEASVNRLAPLVQLGYRYSFCNDWAVGMLAQWKYLNYKTPNVNSSRGQILPNATFSSINIFGPEVIRDFTSKTRLDNEVMLLGYFGKQVTCGYVYLGLGPVLFTASNSVYNSSVHTPNGTGDHLISTSVKSYNTVWGGAALAGYQYFLDQDFFIDISYTYVQTGSCHFNNTINAANFNGANNPGPTTLLLSRKIKFSTQEFMLSMNLQF